MVYKKKNNPKINIDGVFKTPSSGKVNINNVYKQFYPEETYSIKIYRYGNLVDTLNCEKGSSIVLPSIGSGFAISNSTNNITYSGGEEITPTQNLNLYVVNQFTLNFYRYGKMLHQNVYYSQSSYVDITIGSCQGITNLSAFKGFASTGSSTEILYSTTTLLRLNGLAEIYAVFQYDINLYKYGTLINTLSIKTQNSSYEFTLPNCPVDNDDDSLYGWTVTNGNTSISYNAQGKISVSSASTNLYAVFKYLKSYTASTSSIESYEGDVKTVTLPYSGDVVFTGGPRTSYSGHSGGVPTGSTSTAGNFTTGTSAPYIKINNTYQSITLKYGYSDGPAISHQEYLSAGTIIEICGTKNSESTGTSYTGGTTTYRKEIVVTYITAISNKTYAYRSTK